jgi:hypothetical protein
MMLAGMMVVAVVSGTAGAVTAAALALPWWAAFLAYAGAGAVGLMLFGTILAWRGIRPLHRMELVPQMPSSPQK